MDFGVVGLDGLVVCSDSAAAAAAASPSLASHSEIKQKLYGSGFLKQERSAVVEDDWRVSKVAKTGDDDFSASKAIPLLRSNNNTAILSDGQQMLSFSSPSPRTLTMPYYYPHTSSLYPGRNAGFGSGGLNAASLHGVLTTGMTGPFTPSQWMELEHQALIYKYITANVPVPSNLLIPIRKALDSVGFSSFSGMRPQTLGWGAFHLGFSNNTDPEPGRCRRTDGKKWRCSRDAVADQKYCERHMNRGRHRSRKPVEAQTGHSVSGSTTNATTSSKLIPVASIASALVDPEGGGGGVASNNNLGVSHHHQLNNLQHDALPNSSVSPNLNRSLLNKEKVGEKNQVATGFSMLSPNVGLKESQFSLQNKLSEFGLVSSDSLLNPLQKKASLVSCRNYGSSEDLHDRDSKSHQSLHQFMEDWPKNQSERPSNLWPDFDPQSDRTQLSISIPMASSDFMSSTSSPTSEKLTLSPLRLSRDLDSTQMGLGVGSLFNAANQRQANWIPIAWETSMGGPLGEVLHSTNNSSTGDCQNTSALNLLTDGWDSSSSMASSPTGVLQKSTFGSLSNSSAGSSPRAENNNSSSMKEPSFAMASLAQPL